MIKVKIERENDFVKQITITGHANYDIYGKDIVCSSVSSIVITTVNGILLIDSDYLTVTEKKDQMIIEVSHSEEVGDKLIQNMISLLEELSKNYPKNIIVK